VLDGAQIATGSPANVSDVDVVIVGHVPETAGNMVGIWPLVGPDPELPLPPDPPLDDPELDPDDPLDPELDPVPDELFPPELLCDPLDELPDPELDPELAVPPRPESLPSPPELPLPPPELEPKMLPLEAGLPPHAAMRPKARIPRTRPIACLLVACVQRPRSNSAQ